MADYREISQEYAQGGIKAALTINGGAAIALLTQAAALIEKGLASQIKWSLYCWAAGVAVSAVTWVLAFMSTRHVDRSEEQGADVSREIRLSNTYMTLGLLSILMSVL